MINAANIKDREVINIRDGKKIGYVADIEIDFENGKITSIIIPGEGKFLGLFGGDGETVIPWSCIKKVGVDVILVDTEAHTEDEEEDDD